MPSKSEIQQQAAGAALAAKRGEIPVSQLRGASKQMYDDMTEDQLRDFAKTKHDTVPHKVKEGKQDTIGYSNVNESSGGLKLGSKDRKVLESFLDKKPMEGNKLRTDGERLDGVWSGGRGIAQWSKSSGKIELNDLGSRAAQTVQSVLHRMAPASWIKTRLQVSEGEIPSAPADLEKLIAQYDRKELEMGMDVEQEHNRGKTDVVHSPLDTLKIVLAHMKEDPKYYTHLKAMEDKYGVGEAYGTTSKDLDYEDHSSRSIPVPANVRSSSNISTRMEDVDPEFNDGKTKPRLENDLDRIDDEAEDLLFDDEISEAMYPFKSGQGVTYAGKNWNIKKVTRDWIEIEDNRGYTTIVDISDIKSFKNNKIMTEMDVANYNSEIERMKRSAGLSDTTGVVNEGEQLDELFPLGELGPALSKLIQLAGVPEVWANGSAAFVLTGLLLLFFWHAEGRDWVLSKISEFKSKVSKGDVEESDIAKLKSEVSARANKLTPGQKRMAKELLKKAESARTKADLKSTISQTLKYVKDSEQTNDYVTKNADAKKKKNWVV